MQEPEAPNRATFSLLSAHTALLPKPSITSNNSNPMEGEDSVALMCEPETENTSYLWRRNGQSLSEGDRLKLSEDNRTLTLLSVVRNDTGDYECETRNPVSTSRSYPFHLEITCEYYLFYNFYSCLNTDSLS